MSKTASFYTATKPLFSANLYSTISNDVYTHTSDIVAIFPSVITFTSWADAYGKFPSTVPAAVVQLLFPRLLSCPALPDILVLPSCLSFY